jgi:hypothetical protein
MSASLPMTTKRFALGEPATITPPGVTEAFALEDRSWFCERPDRRFRARTGDAGLWLIRRQPQGANPDVYLRTFSRTIVPPSRDGDGELAGLWYRTAYPDWTPERIQKSALRKPR